MTAPIRNRLTRAEAEEQLAALLQQLPESPEEFEERASAYALSPKEQGIWERITELQWLLGK